MEKKMEEKRLEEEKRELEEEKQKLEEIKLEEKKLEEEKRELVEEKKKLEEKEKKLEEKEKKLEEEKKKLEEEKKKLEKKLESCDSEIRCNLQQQLLNTQSQLVELQTQQSQLQTQQSQLEAQQNQLQTQRSQLQQRLADLLRFRITNLEEPSTKKLNLTDLKEEPSTKKLKLTAGISIPMPTVIDYILFYNDTEFFFKIQCNITGRTWSLVYFFLSSVCGPFDIKDYEIRNRYTNNIIDIDFNSPTERLLPGSYTIIAKQSSSQQICILDEYKNWQIIPRAGSRSQSPAQSPTQSPAQSPTRLGSFKERLVARDRGACVITGKTQHTQASHIVALAYWAVAKRNHLPSSVTEVINSLQHNIDSVRNGLLLSPDLHQAFDAGEVVIKYECNDDKCRYVVVALDIGYQEYEGILLWQGPHLENYLPPHPVLLDFHLKSSIMKHMRASAEDEDEDDFDGPYYCIPEMQLVKAY